MPTSLTSLFGGGGGAALGTGLALKAAAAVTAGALVGGAGYEGVQHAVRRHHAGPPAAQTVSSSPTKASPSHAVAANKHEGAKAKGGSAGATSRHGGKSAHGRVKYHGDASIAARHNRLKPKKSHQARRPVVTHGSSPAAAGHSTPKPRRAPPGPYDAGPTPKSKGHAHATGKTHGKGK